MALKTGIVKGDIFLKHIPGDGSPDTPKRLKSIYSMLNDLDMQDVFIDILPKKAEKEDIILFHSLEYFEKIAETKGKELIALTADTHACEDTFDAALYATGGLLKAISLVAAKKLDNAFALIRPPGHHAEKSRAMGYCLFNHVALGAMFAQKVLKLGRILIIDWDIHHGNGTQHAFERDPNVLFFSVHQAGLFPGTGIFTETGLGPGEGYTINLPIPKGYGDAEYVSIFEHLLAPVAEHFAPELILVSAGFDTHKDDPMGGMLMTAEGFAGMTASIKRIADKVCGGKMVYSLEGGYNCDALSGAVKAVLKEMAGITCCDVSAMAAKADNKKKDFVVRRYIEVHRHLWNFF
ncbi:MAG: histone deacetylase [Desulfobacula sp.]|uniref:histone deacetylase family protein n=1 Tax=Desulfobacula sp. TaxID=2593537 RepID=UPI0025C39DCF|nr:histone deacetylase [Desulfobacula sp.]MCD4720187.1 histone deacetylase [Desulfobacula sp.]